MEYLVENGADITVEDNLPLRLAFSYKQTTIIKYLIDKAIEKDIDINELKNFTYDNDMFDMIEYLEDIRYRK